MPKLTAEGAHTGAAAVANCFLDIQEADQSIFPLIDPMKMQKLVYYAHAWWLAYFDTPLFGEDVEAWPWGPVVRTVYSSFVDCGREAIIGKRAVDLIKTGEGFLDFEFREPAAPDNTVRAFLQKVWETHKNLTGVQLSNSTHAKGEPWTIIKEKYGSLDSKPRIPNTLIRDVFRRKLPAA